MTEIVEQVTKSLIVAAVVAAVLVTLANHYPVVAPTVGTLLIGLGILVPGAGVAIYVLDLL